MNKKKEKAVEINQNTLAYRDVDSYRAVKSKDEKTGPSYFQSIRVGEKWEKSLQYRQKWAKENQTIYVLPLNTANEARLIYYIDHLPSVKPYICGLIRKDMENHEIKFTKSWRRDYNNNVGTKRMFSLKFNNGKDADIIEHLENVAAQHISKRAYIIALLEKDIVDTGFKFPKELSEYNKENKIVKNKLTDQFYKAMYYYIETEIKKGNTTINNREARAYINNRMEINPHTLARYWQLYFVETGAIKLQENSKSIYNIDVEKFNQLVNPMDIIV